MGFISEKDILDSQLANHADAFKSDDEIAAEAWMKRIEKEVGDVPGIKDYFLRMRLYGLYSKLTIALNDFQKDTAEIKREGL